MNTLLYVWIDNYKSISKQGFNLSSKYNFEFDSKTLTISDNDNYIENFFSFNQSDVNSGKISELTALIGENGSGKSSFIDFIIENFFTKKKFNLNKNCLFIYETKDKIVYSYKTINKSKNDELSQLLSEKEKEVNKYKLSHTKIEYIDKRKDKKKQIELYEGSNDRLFPETIYYNPSFNSFYNDFDLYPNSEVVDFRNLSETNFLIRDYNDYSIEYKLDLSFGNSSLFINHKFQEIIRQINFLINTNKVFLKDYPNLKNLKYLIFKANFNAELSFIGILEDENDPEKGKTLKYNGIRDKLNFFKELQKRFDKESNKRHEEFYQNELAIYRSIVFSFLLDFLNGYTSFHSYDSIIRPVEWLLKQDALDNETIKVFFEQLKDIKGFENLVSSCINCIDFIGKLDSISNFSLDDEFFYIDFNKSSKFLNSYMNSFFRSSYLSFNWGYKKENEDDSIETINLSFGETLMLSMFSRLYTVIQTETERKNFLLLIDEGELGLHPNWQKKFIATLIKYIEHFFKNCNVQIIITSHSPFIVSDLPSSNIVFLKRSKHNYLTEIQEEKQNSFAENIYSLFKNDFFMDSLIGDFSSEKINKVITSLKEESILLKRLDEIDKIINFIGEPILRNKLRSIYNSRKEITIDKKIKDLEKQLEELRKNK